MRSPDRVGAFTDDRYPAALSRRRRQVWWRLGLLTLLASISVLDDLEAGTGYGVADERGEMIIDGVVAGGSDGSTVRYRHPVTGQDVRATLPVWSLPTPVDGDAVRIVVNADPMHAELYGDRFGPAANLSWYLTLLGVAFVLALPWWAAHRTVGLRAAPTPPTEMVGVLAERGRFRRRLDLDLYEPGAPAGSRSVGAVPVLSIAPVAVDTPFVVQVAGRPGPWRRVVARTGSTTLWPRRRCYRSTPGWRPAGHPVHPDGWAEVPPPSAHSGLASLRPLLPPAATALAAAALVLVVAILSVRGSDREARFVEGAERRVATVVGHRSDDTVVELSLEGSDGRRVRVNAEVAASEHPIGTRYEVWVDPRGDPAAVFVAWPYDTIEPIIWASVPLVAALGWLLSATGRVRAVAAAARRGPWRRATARLDDMSIDAALVLTGPTGTGVGVVPIASPDASPGASTGSLGTVTVVVGGDPGPHAPIALWHEDGTPIRVEGPMLTGASVPTLESLDGVGPADAGSGRRRWMLRHYRWVRRARRPFVGASGGQLEIFVPQWFGGRLWRVPLREVAVIDHTDTADLTAADEVEPTGTVAVLAEDIVVPYLITTSPNAAATTTLLFETPQRIPPLRWFMLGSTAGVSWTAARSARGLTVDGVQVRFVAPKEASRQLVAAGAEKITDAHAWLVARREVVTDPVAATRLVSRVRRRSLLDGFALMCSGVGIVFLTFFTGDEPSWTAVLPGIGLAVMPVLVSVGSRFGDRRQGRPGDRHEGLAGD